MSTEPGRLDAAGLAAVKKWLTARGACDGGLPMASTCYTGDARVLGVLLLHAYQQTAEDAAQARTEVEDLRQERDAWEAEFTEARNDARKAGARAGAAEAELVDARAALEQVRLQLGEDYWAEHVCGFDGDPIDPLSNTLRPIPPEPDGDCGACWQAVLSHALARPAGGQPS